MGRLELPLGRGRFVEPPLRETPLSRKMRNPSEPSPNTYRFLVLVHAACGSGHVGRGVQLHLFFRFGRHQSHQRCFQEGSEPH